MKKLAKLLAKAAAITAAFSAQTAFAETTYIHAGSVITDASGEASGPATIIVTDGKIVSIKDGFLATPEGATMVHLPEKTVLPGLIDLHVHLTGDPGGDFWKEAIEPDEWGVVVSAKNAPLTALAGFTTVREAGSAQQTAYSLRRGVKIAFGTDAGVFDHGRNAEEFRLMMGQGMSSRQALASATTVAAEVLDMENEIGRMAPGYSADIIAVNGNPLDDATVLENVGWVMVRGKVME